MTEVTATSEIVEAAASALLDAIGDPPRTMMVLGSGLGALADAVEEPVELSFAELPGFPPASVEGHAGRYIAGAIEGRRVLVQSGRVHAYEGHGMDVVVLPVRIAARMGIETLILTNAAGGIHQALDPGSLMLIEDHINLMGRNPLVGPVQDNEVRFPDMSRPYDPGLRTTALAAALAERIPLVEGTYVALLGPSYETPAEIRMIERLGGDAVGMSTVPECIAARALGLRVLGFSSITNRAAGLSPEPLDHADVVEVGRRAGEDLERILRRVLRSLP